MNIFVRGFRRLFGGNATHVEKGEQQSEPDIYTQGAAAQVSEDTALQLSAMWACTRLISEVFAGLPLTMKEKNSGSGEKLSNHPTLLVLNDSPNSRQTPVEFRETMQLNLNMHGNAYARIEYNRRGDLIALWPLPAQQMQTQLLDDGSVVHNFYHGSDVTVYADSSILHIRLFGNGIVGLSPLAYARNTIGLATAVENHSSKFFVHGGKPSGVLYTDAALNETQRKKARETFSEVVTQKEESKRLLVLPLGFKYQATEVNPADMQILESKHFSLRDICRFFGNVPPVLIGETQDSTTLGSSIEQILIGWYRLGLNPYATRWEQALAKKLLKPAERRRYEYHVDFDALTRGDSKTEMEYLKGMVGGPIMTPNEARTRKNLPPVPGGDKLNPSPTEGKKASDNEVTDNA